MERPFGRKNLAAAIGWPLVACIGLGTLVAIPKQARQALDQRDRRMAERTEAASRQLRQGVGGVEGLAGVLARLADGVVEGVAPAASDRAVAEALRRATAQLPRLNPAVLRVSYVSRSGFSASIPPSGTGARPPSFAEEPRGLVWSPPRANANGNVDASCTVAIHAQGRWLGNLVIDVAVTSLSPSLPALSSGPEGDFLGNGPMLAPVGPSAGPLPPQVGGALLSVAPGM